MTPEECAFLIRHDFDRTNPEVQRLMRKSDTENDAEHERRMRADPVYAAAWRANIQAFADRVDQMALEHVYKMLTSDTDIR